MMFIKTIVFIFITLLLNTSFAQSPKAQELFEKGVQQNKAGYLIKAVTLLTEAIALNPDYADAYYQRGLSFKGMGNKSYFIKDLN